MLDNVHTWSSTDAQLRRNLSPALFPSWQATCNAFGAAMAAGPGLVMLVGGPGSGKTFTFLAYAGGAGKPVGLRSIEDPLQPGTEIDLVDNVHVNAMARLIPFRSTRALAVGPKLAERLMHAFPRARIVTVQPMLPHDVRIMVEVRLPQLGLPVGYVTSRALARMDELCGGNPRQLDALLFRSLRLAAAATVARMSPGHVEQAAQQLAMEGVSVEPALGTLEREAALRLLGRVEAPMGFDQPRRRKRRASAPDFWPSSLDAQRNLQRVPAASTQPPGKLAVVPRWARLPTPHVTSARMGGPARGERFFAMNPAEAAQAGSRRWRPGFKTAAIAAVAVTAFAATVPAVLEMSDWAGNGGQAVPVDAPTTVASLLPQAAMPGPTGAVLSPTPAPAAKAVPPESVLPSSGWIDPAARQDAMRKTVRGAPPLLHPVAPSRQMAAAEPPRVGPPDAIAQAGPGLRSAAPAGDRPAPAALSAPAASLLAPVPDTTTLSQAVAAVDAASAAEAPPSPETMAGPSPAAVQGAAKEAARLFSLGKALLAINQVDDARSLLKASANMGNSKAAALLAAYDMEAQGYRAPTGPAQVEHSSARGTQAVRAAPKPGRQSPQP